MRIIIKIHHILIIILLIGIIYCSNGKYSRLKTLPPYDEYFADILCYDNIAEQNFNCFQPCRTHTNPYTNYTIFCNLNVNNCTKKECIFSRISDDIAHYNNYNNIYVYNESACTLNENIVYKYLLIRDILLFTQCQNNIIYNKKLYCDDLVTFTTTKNGNILDNFITDSQTVFEDSLEIIFDSNCYINSNQQDSLHISQSIMYFDYYIYKMMINNISLLNLSLTPINLQNVLFPSQQTLIVQNIIISNNTTVKNKSSQLLASHSSILPQTLLPVSFLSPISQRLPSHTLLLTYTWGCGPNNLDCVCQSCEKALIQTCMASFNDTIVSIYINGTAYNEANIL